MPHSLELLAVEAPDLGDVWSEAIGGAIVLVAAVALAWLWKRRRKPLDWAARGENALAERRRRLERAKHDELVRWVLQRAEVLKLRVPVKVTGRNPVLVALHPPGPTQAIYRDPDSYRSAVERGDVNPVNARFGKTPLAVSRWSDDQLRSWLRDHADDVPPESEDRDP